MDTEAAQADSPRLRSDAAVVRCERGGPWRALLRDADGMPADPSGGCRTVTTVPALDGVSLVRAGVDPMPANPAEGRGDRVLLALFLGNCPRGRQEKHEAAGDTGSGFYLLDCTRLQTVIPLHDSIRLFLPREKVTRLLGKGPTGDGGCRHLPTTSMGEVLKAHLVALMQHDPSLAAPAAAFCTNATVSMALAFLAQFGTADAARDSDGLLFDEACRYIDAYLYDPRLTVAGVARVLGCSRTRLYRVFAEREWSVAAYARDQRLLRSRRLLRDTRMSIGEVALRCGYGDLPAFGKAFKRRFGLSPGEWRRMIASAARSMDGEGPGA